MAVSGLEKAWWSAAQAVNATRWGAADLHAWVPEGLRVNMATNAPGVSAVLGDVGIPQSYRAEGITVLFEMVGCPDPV